MQTAQQIMTSRVDKLGVTSPNVAIQGGNEIVIQLAGIHDPNKAAKIIGTTGQLQFFDFEKDLAPPTVSQGRPTPASSLFALLTAVKSEAKKGSPEAYYLFRVTKVTKNVTTTVKGKKVTKKKTTTHTRKLQGPEPSLHQLLLPPAARSRRTRRYSLCRRIGSSSARRAARPGTSSSTSRLALPGTRMGRLS